MLTSDQVGTSQMPTLVTIKEFLLRAETHAIHMSALASLPDHIAAEAASQLCAEMTALTAVAVRVMQLTVESGCDDAQSLTKVQQGVQYVRLLQVLGLDVRSTQGSEIGGAALAQSLDEFSTSAATVSKLLKQSQLITP